jgi:mRNA-degrading endonuclease RelE of RelBE toxin-antitoxin system
LEALPEPIRKRATDLTERLDREHGLGKKLQGPLKGVRSARLGRSHRILYEIKTDGSAHVLTIALRKDAYR